MIDPDPVERQLALAWQAFTPPSQLRERVRARLSASGQVPLSAAPAPSAVAPNRWRSLRQSGNVGLAVGVGLFGLGCVAGWLGSVFVAEPLPPTLASARISVPEPASLAAAPASTPRALATPAPPEAPGQESAPVRSASSAPELVRRPAPRATTARDWRGELALLERAERAVRADNAALALALLGDFDVRYPKSLLIEERAAVETMSHCQANATDSAARAARFLSAYPSSVYRARVGAVCKPEAPASTQGPL